MTLRAPAQHRRATSIPECKEVCGTADLEIGWAYMKQVEIVGDDRSSPRSSRVIAAVMSLGR
jgi:hypothetical protein